MWDLLAVSDAVEATLRGAEAALADEQAVYGLDSWDELRLHAALADGLAATFEVAREVHYPSSAGKPLSARPRCDLVLTPRGRPLRRDHAPATLFDPPASASASEALWIEVKLAQQYRSAGVSHGGYGGQWRQAVVADLLKMEADPLIRDAALLLIVFTESTDVLAKDLELFEVVLARKEVLAGFRQVRSVPIVERMGHRLCSASLWPTIQR